MKTIFFFLFFTSSLFTNGVFGDETERVSVNDGDSVTLHTHVTELQTDDLIMWRFKDDLIAKINREVNSDPVYDSDERFTDRLKMNPQTGDLTITHITSELTGDFQLGIDRGKKIIKKSFSVTGGLSSGAIAGICVGVLLVIAAAVAGVFYRRHRLSRSGMV